MDRYQIICTIYKLPKHQRKTLMGKPITRDILGHDPVREKSFYLSSNEVNIIWDQLKELQSRGEVEVRKPDGTILRFSKPKIIDPPEDKIQRLPMYKPIGNSFDYEEDEDLESTPTPSKEEEKKTKKKTKKKKGRRKKNKKEEDK